MQKTYSQKAVTAIFVILICISGAARSRGNETRESSEAASSPANQGALPEHPNHRRFNVRISAGADFALGDTLEERDLGDIGGQGAIGIDWVIIDPLAFSILVGYSAFSKGDSGALQDLFATAGFQLRLFADRKGALGERGGNVWGHLFLDSHFGYHNYENEDHAGYNIGLGFELSLARDFNLGPYVRFAHTPIGDGFSYASIAFGVQASVGGKFGPDDADKDNIEDNDDLCPLAPEDIDTFEDEDGCPDEDNDGDGVLDSDDECPDTAGVPAVKGCPEVDNDKDGVLNDDDACMEAPEDKDKFEDEDGCPDPDNDADGVADDVDKCPVGPEDKDGFEDEDGCEDKDNDQDGVLDDEDQCPMLPESVNEINDDDGCPDFVRLTETRIELLSSVSFEKNTAKILDVSHPMLKEVAGLLKLKQEITLRIEGHTDDRGGKKQSLKRSKSKAESVKAFLVAEGIEEKRLRAEGIGQERPIEDNKTKAGREKNNRIELHIVEQPQGEGKETPLDASSDKSAVNAEPQAEGATDKEQKGVE